MKWKQLQSGCYSNVWLRQAAYSLMRVPPNRSCGRQTTSRCASRSLYTEFSSLLPLSALLSDALDDSLTMWSLRRQPCTSHISPDVIFLLCTSTTVINIHSNHSTALFQNKTYVFLITMSLIHWCVTVVSLLINAFNAFSQNSQKH